MTLNGRTKTEKRPLRVVVYWIAAILVILGWAATVAAGIMQSDLLMKSGYFLVLLGLVAAGGNAIMTFAKKPRKP
jgi:Ca2+/Na+ antiporter